MYYLLNWSFIIINNFIIKIYIINLKYHIITFIIFSLCCECGTPIDPNPSNQCIGCIRTKVDITEDIPKSGSICFCKGCERYLEPPSCWRKVALESRELLRLCLKRVKGLNQVRLVNANFLWTEEHSKRIKVSFIHF